MSVERVLVAKRDSVVETTIIHVQTNEAGDTLRVAQVTERERVRNRDAIAVQKTETKVVRDTVYVAVRDSTSVSTVASDPSTSSGRAPAWLSALKWIFWIIVSLTVLIVVFKLTRRF